MASSFEKSVKGATKVKLAAPKSKYVEHILIATHAGEAGIAEVFRALNNRLKDQTWTIVFKSLIIVHLMIREGEKDVTLKYLRKNPRTIAVSNYTDVQEQGRNIRHYSQYLHERARAYGDVKTDYVRNGEGRLRKLSIEKGLLREVECVQQQIRSLLRCSFLDGEVDNEITLTAFRLLVMDLLVFFHVVNEGVINVLEHYFEMSRYDAERALEIYKTFTKQTADVVEYLQTARRLETSTRLQIPNLKHAPTSLTQSLEEYLHDPDFDINRRQYLAAQDAKKNGGPSSTKVDTEDKNTSGPSFPSPKATAEQPAGSAKGVAEVSMQQQPKVAADLIDFFDSIETEQTTLFSNDIQQAQQQQLAMAQGQFQQSGFAQPSFAVQSQQPFPSQVVDFGTYPLYNSGSFAQPIPTSGPPALQPVRTDFTGHGFGGYTPQDQNSVSIPPMPTIPQQYQADSFQQPTIQQQFQHVPAQQFQIQQQQTPSPSLSIPASQDTNPFRQSMMMTGTSPSSLTSQPKSTNPFARAANAQQSASSSGTSPLTSYPTGPVSSSPFSTSPTVQQPLRSVQTGTNPFARNLVNVQAPSVPALPSNTVSTSASMLSVHPTGTTNPFRASMMMQQQQQQQVNGKSTGTIPGWENIETIPVFPRNN